MEGDARTADEPTFAIDSPKNWDGMEPPAASTQRETTSRTVRRFRAAQRRAVEPLGTPGPQWVEPAIWSFVILGLVLRALRYAQNLPLWSDECFLAVNFIQRGFLDLLGPLDNGQISPPLFLWIERAAVGLWGFSEFSLRLFPFVCGLASMVLFERFARLTLRGAPLLLAVAIFAVSVHPIRHAAEAKPYASDLLVSLAMATAAAAWLRERDRSRWLWALLGLLPASMALSNPSVFVAGGLIIGLAAPVWRSRRWADRLALVCCAAMLAGLFLTIHIGFGRLQSAGAIDGLRRYWSADFPPMDDPLQLPGWLVSAVSGSMMAHPGGGDRGESAATLLAVIVGAAVLVRRRRGALLACLLAPLGLNLLAAIFERYPFGGEARLAQYAAPALCLLSGAGAAAVWELVRSEGRRNRLLIGLLVALVICGVVPQVVSWRTPYRMVHDQESREFARTFWPELARDAEVACAHLDFHLDEPGRWQGARSWHLVNQAIYSPQRRRFGGPRLDLVSADRPLRCVVFEEDPDAPNVSAWLARMRLDYRLRAMRTIAVPATLGPENRKLTETLRVYEFIPNGEGAEN